MKKKILNIIFVICLMVPCMLMFGACGPTPPEEPLTNAELSTLYKEVAVEAWETAGVSDPTAPSAQATLLSVSVPDKKQETDDVAQIANINMNANSMAGFVYMVSLLYANENFATTNNIAVFDAQIMLGTQSFDQHFVLTTELSKQQNKVAVEVIVTVNGVAQYSNVEISYDFNTQTLLSYRFITQVMDNYVDMALTQNDKYMWYSTNDEADTYAVAVNALKIDLQNRAESVQKLATNFGTEVQTYMDIVQQVMADMM